MHKIPLISLLALGSYLGNGPLFAQNAANDGSNNLSLPSTTDSFNPTFTPERQDVEFEDPQLLPSLDQLLRSPGGITDPLSPLPEDIPGQIEIKGFKVSGSDIFSPEQINEVVKDYLNRPISFVELLRAQDEITKLYIDNGYITTGAYIPPQTIADGFVQIEVLEGSLADISIAGLNHLSENYIRDRLNKGTAVPVNVNNLVDSLQLLQLNPNISNISAELTTGTTVGTSILDLDIKETKRFHSYAKFDNGRSPSVGTLRAQARLSRSSLLASGDELALAYVKTDGSDTLDELAYRIPINAEEGTLSFAYRHSDNQVIEEPFDAVNIKSNSDDYSLSLRQPLYRKPGEEIALGITFDRRSSKTTLADNFPFPSLGSDDNGETRLSMLRFFQDWTRRTNEDVIALRSQLSVGLDIFDATEPTPSGNAQPDGKFVAWRGQAQYLKLLDRDTTFLVRGDVQLASEAVNPLEQFGLGGGNNVRGYRQDAFLADNGIFASAEVRLPFARISQWDTVVQLVPFFDIGTIWNDKAMAAPAKSTLSSVGLGLLWNTKDKFTVRLDWGIPLVSIEGPKNTWQENGIHFSFEYRP